MALLCVSIQADRRTKTLSPYGKHTNQAEMCLSSVESFLITAIIKVPSYCGILQVWRNKCEYSYTLDLTILVAWYSLALFFKCRSLITLPTGISADMWEYCVAACRWHFNRLYIASAFPKHHPLVHCSLLSVPDMNMVPPLLSEDHRTKLERVGTEWI